MTIDEAIIHAREVAECREDMCKECRQEHEQLAEWLEELKAIKNGFTDDLLNMGFTKGYNKAIDDFNCYVQHEESIGNIKSLDDYDRIAERLKDGGVDE